MAKALELLSFYVPLCQGFLTSAMDIWSWVNLSQGEGGYSVYCRIFSSILGLCPREPGIIPPVTPVKISQCIAKITPSKEPLP